MITTVNTATYQLTKLINEVFKTFNKSVNVQENFSHRINMKNEFLLRRFIATRNKKNYASIVLMQEGNILEPPKLDIKGLAIKKVSTNPTVRKYFTELLNEDILLVDKIDLSLIFSKFKELDTIIRNSLKNGEVDFLIPGKVNMLESYVNPYTIMSLRGTIAWNNLFPDDEISLPNKVNMLKLKIDDLNDIQDMDDVQYNIIKSKIFDNENLSKYGMKILTIPKTVSKIPDFILPYIDIDTMVLDNIKPGIILLESLGFSTLDILTKQLPTNIINI